MFIMVTGLYDRPLAVNLDTVTHIRPADKGAKIHTLNGTIDVETDFDTLVELVMSATKKAK